MEEVGPVRKHALAGDRRRRGADIAAPRLIDDSIQLMFLGYRMDMMRV